MRKVFVQVQTQCPFCNDIAFIEITLEQFQRLESGEAIQIVLSNFTLEERERLISETCPDCWDKLF